MIAKVQKWGNSQGVRFPVELLRNARISTGDTVDLSVERGKIIIKPTKTNRKKYKLKDLLEKMPENYSPEEIDFGKPTGKEIW